MPIRTRSFSGRLLRRVRSKAKLETPPEPVPDVPLLPAVHLDSSLHLPFAPSSSSPPSSSPAPAFGPKKGLHRRSRSFSELLSIASSTASHDQPWRSREAWAAIHSPAHGPVRKKERSVMDRTYGWMERTRDNSLASSGEGEERDVPGRQDFKFFHNTQIDLTSPSSSPVPTRSRPGRSRLNESVRYTSASGSSSSISTMDLSLNPHTPPTSVDSPHQHFHHHAHAGPPSDDDSPLPLPPLLPDLVKRADSPPAFTRAISPAPWAQRSPNKDIREASNLRWAQTPPDPQSSTETTPSTTPQQQQQQQQQQLHRRKRSLTAPSVFDKAAPALGAGAAESRTESGTLPSPPRPARHPRRYPPQPIVASADTEPQFSTPLSSPAAITSPVTKTPSAYYRPTVPLRSASSQQSLRAGHMQGSRRPSTAPSPGFNPSASKETASPGSGHSHPVIYSPPPSATFATRSRPASIQRGGWI